MRDSGVLVETGALSRFSTVFISLLGLTYIVYLFLWQASYVVALKKVSFAWDGWEVPAKVLRIDQRWRLFAPYSLKDDGWYVVPGTLKNGAQVDLFRKGATLTFRKPESVFAIYKNERWRRYTLNLWQKDFSSLRPYYARYLCRNWNSTHSKDQHLDTLEIIYMLEHTPPPGAPPPDVKPTLLLQWTCEE